MSQLMYISSFLSILVAILFGLVLLGLGVVIWVRGHVRIGGLLALSGLVHTVNAILSPLVYSMLNLYGLGVEGFTVANVVFGLARLLFWLPLIGALGFTVVALPKGE